MFPPPEIYGVECVNRIQKENIKSSSQKDAH